MSINMVIGLLIAMILCSMVFGAYLMFIISTRSLRIVITSIIKTIMGKNRME